MRSFKKIAALFLVVAMVCSLVAIPAFAAENITLRMELDTASLEKGDTATLNIYAEGANASFKYSMANYEVAYDNTVFEVESTTTNGGFAKSSAFGIMDLAEATVEKGTPIQTVTLKAIKNVAAIENYEFKFEAVQFVDEAGADHIVDSTSTAKVDVKPSFDITLKTVVEPSTLKTGATATLKIYANTKAGSFKYSMANYEVAYDNTVFEVESTTTNGGFAKSSAFGIMDLAEATVTNDAPIQTVTLKALKSVDNIEDFTFKFEAVQFVDETGADYTIDTSATAKISIVPSFEAKFAAVEVADSFEVGTDVAAELAKLTATAYDSANMDGKKDTGFATKDWKIDEGQAADYAANKPGTYTFVGTVVADEAKSAFWTGTLTATVAVTVDAIASAEGVTIASNVTRVTVKDSDKTEWNADDILAEVAKKTPVVTAVKGAVEDTFEAANYAMTAAIDAPLADEAGKEATVKVKLNASKNGSFDLTKDDNAVVEIIFAITPAEIIAGDDNKGYDGVQVEVPSSVATDAEEIVITVNRDANTGEKPVKVTLVIKDSDGNDIKITVEETFADADNKKEFKFNFENMKNDPEWTKFKAALENGNTFTVEAEYDGVVVEDEAGSGSTAEIIPEEQSNNKRPAGIGNAIGGGAAAGPSAAAKPEDGTTTPEEGTEGEGTTTEPGTTEAGSFTDVSEAHWAFEAIETLKALGVINGTSETSFTPDGNVTRAEFTKMVAVLFGLEASTTESPFTDCTADDWFTPYVIAASEAGYVNGVAEGKFAPNENISRQDICTVLGRILKAEGTAEITFADQDQIAEYALPYVMAFVSMGVINGYPEDNTFRPEAPATRAEAAKIIYGVASLDN